MKFKDLIQSVLLEASKADTLINKLGVNTHNAESLSKIVGPLSIFFAYKILEKYEAEYNNLEDRFGMSKEKTPKNVKERFQLINKENAFIHERNSLRNIMDWVRVGLNGNIKPYQKLTFDELYDESERWHESLGIGDSKIDYVEENQIILDYRKDGEGYYWADLGSINCPEEAERMGHCASSKGNLYSLRNFKKIENDHTLNRSYLTASIDGDGDLLQLKGVKNSKPPKEFHSLILPLLYFKEDGEYLINGFGYEYNSANDFKISDLTEDEIKKLYTDRPEIFKGRQEKKLLRSLGLIEANKYSEKFTLKIPPTKLDYYVTGEYSNILTDVINGDTYQYWDNAQHVEWKYAADNELNDQNRTKIIELLKQTTPDLPEDIKISDLLDEFDEDDEIKNRIRWSVNDAEADDYQNYLYKNVVSAFEEYGKIISLNDEGAVIEVDLESLIQSNKIDDEDLDEIAERCEGDNHVECLFDELLGDGHIEKPRLDIDDRWYPDADRDNFNEILNDRLHEI
jgi:hypothetical protein